MKWRCLTKIKHRSNVGLLKKETVKITKDKVESLAGVFAGLSFMIAFYIGYLEGWFACAVPFVFGVGYLIIGMLLHNTDNSN